MQYDFLKDFPKRMKNVGLYAMIFANSSLKSIWKQYGFETFADQLNIIYSVMLYIMEQSLKEEPCTIDDITGFIDDINGQYYRRPMNFEACHDLGDFIVNDILSNGGSPMYFAGYDYAALDYQQLHITYVANKIIYVEQEIKRTSYYLTDDGYSLLLGTLEVESNMKLTIQEMIFQLHMEKQSYDRALDDVKNIFNLMRIQLQKIQEAMRKIRRNALEYSVGEYEALMEENLGTINKTKEKFQGYRDSVRLRVKEMEEKELDFSSLTKENEENLRNLREIERYLSRAIDEHQRILESHFDLKSLYTVELEKVTEMSLVQRFSFKTEIYDRLMDNPLQLENLATFLHALFNQEPKKCFNLNKILEAQRLHLLEEEAETTIETFDEETWAEEQKRLRELKLTKYYNSLVFLFDRVVEKKNLKLSRLIRDGLTAEAKGQLVPDTQIFKELMVELLRLKKVNFAELRAEKADFLQGDSNDFHLLSMLLDIFTEREEWQWVQQLEVKRLTQAPPVIILDVQDEKGARKNIRCSDIQLIVRGEAEHGL